MSEADHTEVTVARERSTIEFPYADLSEATGIVRVIHQSGGLPMDRDQIAVRMGQKPTSGAFTTKVSAARMFQLVEVQPGSGKIAITPLGHELISLDEARQQKARAEAFLNVELYRKLYDEFRNRHLPPRPTGLEQAMVGFGVAPKQRTNARYAFDRSAKQAGYFDHGPDRLVAPVAITPHPTVSTPATGLAVAQAAQMSAASVTVECQLDGVIVALIDKLPTEGPFPAAKREAWLTMMAMAFDMAYGPEPGVRPPPGGRAPSFLGGAPMDTPAMQEEVRAARPDPARQGARAMDLSQPAPRFAGGGPAAPIPGVDSEFED